jgi:hypothetical protein
MQVLEELVRLDKNMLSKLYNKIGDTTKKMGGSISDIFSSKPIVYKKEEVVSKPNYYELKDRGVKITEEDINNFRPLLYGESSNRDFEKKQLEADVIFNTALNRQKEHKRYMNKEMTISEIISDPTQYQAYGGEQYKNYFNPKNPVETAKKKEIDAIVDSIAEKIKKGQYVDNTEGAFYYIHEDDGKIKYDNLRKLYK